MFYTLACQKRQYNFPALNSHISFEWDGTPSSRGNYDAGMHTSLINEEFQQCFEYEGGFYSANGVDGLLKCTTGNFVAEISNTDNF